LLDNQVDLSKGDSGKRAILALLAKRKDVAPDIQMILSTDRIDIENGNKVTGRSVLDWADNGYLCSLEGRSAVYQYYRSRFPEKAKEREEKTQPNFMCQFETGEVLQEQQKIRILAALAEQKRKQLSKDEDVGKNAERASPTAGTKNMNEALLEEGVQVVHFIGELMTFIGERARKVNKDDIYHFPMQKIKDIINTHS